MDNEYLNLIAENELKNARNEYGLNAVKLKTLHEAILSRLLISYLSEFGFSRPEKKQKLSKMAAFTGGRSSSGGCSVFVAIQIQ